MAQKKRKVFSIEEKSHIIWRLENGEANIELAKECGVSHSTISTIWKNRDKIKSLFEKNCLKVKRSRPTQHTIIDFTLLNWFKQQRNNNIPISGPILQEKANELMRTMGQENVEITSSWIQRFRVRHNIVFGKISGEENDVCKEVPEEWLKTTWPLISEGYQPDEIFNADETGLFFNMTPDKTLKFKGEKCSGGKMSKARLTIMVAANMTGSCKEKLMVIGKSKKPRCFKNVNSLPVTYESNKKAWMTSDIFEKWLRNWDARLKSREKKILLLVDNCPAHPKVFNLECIKLVFLPPNVTSVLQPMDQGVIKALKTQYRKMHVLELLRSIQETGEKKMLSVLDSILMVSEAWNRLSATTIANCFAHAGFKHRPITDTIESDSDEDNIPLATIAKVLKEKNQELVQLTEKLLEKTVSIDEVEAFVDLDNNLEVCATTTIEQLLEEGQSQLDEQDKDEQDKDDEDEDNVDEIETPSLSKALGALKTLQKFMVCDDELGTNQNQELLRRMQLKMEKKFEFTCKKQQKITDYFK